MLNANRTAVLLSHINFSLRDAMKNGIITEEVYGKWFKKIRPQLVRRAQGEISYKEYEKWEEEIQEKILKITEKNREMRKIKKQTNTEIRRKVVRLSLKSTKGVISKEEFKEKKVELMKNYFDYEDSYYNHNQRKDKEE